MSEEIKKVITVDTKEAVSSLDAVSQSTDRAGQSFKTLQEYENYVQSLTNKLSKLTKGTEEYESVSKELTEAQQELNAELSEVNTNLEDTDSKIKDLKDRIPEYNKNVQNLGKSFQQVGKSAKGSEPFIKRATAAVKAFATATVVLKVLQVTLDAIKKLFERNTEATERLKKTLSKFEPALKAVDKVFTSIVTVVSNLADRYIPRLINTLNKVFKFIDAYYKTVIQGIAKVLNSLHILSDESYEKIRESAQTARDEFIKTTDEITNYIITQSTKTLDELKKENQTYRDELAATGKSYEELSKRREEVKKLLELVKHNKTWWTQLNEELEWLNEKLELFKKIEINDYIILVKSSIEDANKSISNLDAQIASLEINITKAKGELSGLDNPVERKRQLKEIEQLEEDLYNKRVERGEQLVKREIANEQLKAAEIGKRIKLEEAESKKSVSIQKSDLESIKLNYKNSHKQRLADIDAENKKIEEQVKKEKYLRSELYKQEQEYNEGRAQNAIELYTLEQKVADAREKASKNIEFKSSREITSDYLELIDVTREYNDILVNNAELEYNLAVERAKYRGEDITKSREVSEAFINLSTVRSNAEKQDIELRKELGQTIRQSKKDAKDFVEQFIGDADTISDKIQKVQDNFKKAVAALKKGGGIRTVEELERARDEKIGVLWLEDIQNKINEINNDTSFKLQFIDPNNWKEQSSIIEEGIRKQLELWKTLRESGKLTEEQMQDADKAIHQLEQSLDQLGKTGRKDMFGNEISKGWEEATEKAQQVTSELGAVNDGIAGLANAIGDYWTESINQRLEAGEISEEQAEEEFERVKGVQIAAAIVQGLSGAATAVAQAMSLGPVLGPIVGALNAATVLTTTALQVKQIKATKIGSDNISTSIPKSNISEYKPDYTTSVTGLSEEERLSDIYKKGLDKSDIRVYVLESDITDAQNKKKAKVAESSF